MNADVAFRAAKHALATLLALLALGSAAPAQEYPSVPDRRRMSWRVWSPTVCSSASAFVVENKPGVSGNLGTDIVAKARPDSSTLGVSIGGPHAINTLLFSRLPYDPRKDLKPITQLVTQPSVLAVHPAQDVNSLVDLLLCFAKIPADWCTCPIPVRRRPSPP
jgi:hypothetical protein